MKQETGRIETLIRWAAGACHRGWSHSLLLVCACVIASAPSPAAGEPPSDGSVLRLHVVTDAGEIDGTCVLIHREDRGAEVVFHFLTSPNLFRGANDESTPRTHAVRVQLDSEHALDIPVHDVLVPRGALTEVAVLRATTAPTTNLARRILYAAPSVGDVFLIAGYGRDGAPATVAERVRFQSSRLVVGDRDASPLVGCVGAPAISQQGVFGVVSECNAGRAPIIALLSMAQSFIERHVPRPSTQTSLTPQFDLADRQITGPLLLVGCDATKTGELDVPLDLGSREWAVDETAAFAHPHEVRRAEIAVLNLQERSVRLRFTIGDVPSAPTPPVSCPQGQALVTVPISVVVGRAPE
jgi:hypothetical protein